MTFAIAEPERLVAADLRFEMIPPLGFEVGFPVDMDDAEVETIQTSPSFLVSARALAERSPDSPAALARLAQAEQAAGNGQTAVSAAYRVLEMEDSSPDLPAAVSAIQILLTADEHSVDERLINRIPGDGEVKRVLGARLAVRRGELERALDRLGDASSSDALAIKAWILLERGKFAEAIGVLRKAVRQGPNASLLANLGYAYAAIGARDKAVKVTLQARKLDPSSRLIVMNLVSFYRAGGDIPAAIAELQKLRGEAPDDVRLHIAEADLRLAIGDDAGAAKVLTRARTSHLWVVANTIERAELETNLAFLRLRRGELTPDEMRAEVAKQLQRVDYESLDIASMLPTLCRTVRERDTLAFLLRELELHHRDGGLEPLRLQLAFLECDFETAADRAIAWAKADIFNPDAAAAAVLFLCDVRSAYDEAATLGVQAFKRSPASMGLLNNAAYALTLAGRLEDAKKLAEAGRDEDVHLRATRALIDILSSRIEQGIAGYRAAFDAAQANGDDTLAFLVWMNGMIALRRVGLEQRGLGWDVPLPDDWADDPRLVLVRQLDEQAR